MHPFPSEPSYLRCFTAIQATNPGHLIKSMGSRFGSELLLIQQLSAPGLSECQTEHSACNSSHLVDTLGRGTQNDSGLALSHFNGAQIQAVTETKLV